MPHSGLQVRADAQQLCAYSKRDTLSQIIIALLRRGKWACVSTCMMYFELEQMNITWDEKSNGNADSVSGPENGILVPINGF